MKIKNYNLPIDNLDYPNKENRNDVKLIFKINPSIGNLYLYFY